MADDRLRGIFKAAAPGIKSGVETFIATSEAERGRRVQTLATEEKSMLQGLTLQLKAEVEARKRREGELDRAAQQKRWNQQYEIDRDKLAQREKEATARNANNPNSPEAIKWRIAGEVLDLQRDFDYWAFAPEEQVMATNDLVKNVILPEFKDLLTQGLSGNTDPTAQPIMDPEPIKRIKMKAIEGKATGSISKEQALSFWNELSDTYDENTIKEVSDWLEKLYSE